MDAAQLLALGYPFTRQLPTGEWAGLGRFIFTTGLLVGLDETGYRTRFCYEHQHEAIVALYTWDGVGDPPGPWLKEKGRVERCNPMRNSFHGIPVINEHALRMTGEGQGFQSRQPTGFESPHAHKP